MSSSKLSGKGVQRSSRHCLLYARGSLAYYSLGDIIIVFVLEDPMTQKSFFVQIPLS